MTSNKIKSMILFCTYLLILFYFYLYNEKYNNILFEQIENG